MTVRRAKGVKGKRYNLYSKKTGRKLNKKPLTKKKLIKRERQINWFKHMRGRRRR